HFAYYNLGVVYTELGQPEAAKVAFTRATEKKPDHWPSFYALACNCYETSEFKQVRKLCQRVFDLNPEWAAQARAHDLKGLAELAEAEAAPNPLPWKNASWHRARRDLELA